MELEGKPGYRDEEEAANLLSYSKSFGFRLKRAFFLNTHKTEPSSSHTSKKKKKDKEAGDFKS